MEYVLIMDGHGISTYMMSKLSRWRCNKVEEMHVLPMMRLYLPRVEARLRGITALWFCRKKGHLHTIPCNEQEWDKELAYNRHFTQYINIIHTSSKIQTYRPTTVKIQMKIRQPQMLDPRSSQLGSTTDHQEKTHSNDHVPRRTPT